MIYTVTLNPSLDYYLSLPALHPGTLHRVQDAQLLPGGKGVNVAIVLSRLGVPVRALGFAAGHTGALLTTLLREIGLDTDFVTVPDGMTRLNVKISTESETELNGAGPDIPSDAFEALLCKMDGLEPDDILVLSGSAPASLPADAYNQLAQRAQARGAHIVADTTGQRLTDLLPCRPFLIKPNTLELAEVSGQTADTAAGRAAQARQLQALGARNVLVSCGAEGAVLVTEDGDVLTGQAPQGTVRSTVGAGDSMVAGFLAGWLDGGSYEAALRLGLSAGSATAFRDGLAERGDIDRLLSEAHVTA